ncbi:MAG TPA: FAD-dependent oxidoreductase [Pyrinomonadaceae bacterium]|nr:FAD-dependent oxidoreductase [Pyrinomonadaceae bacterium]
MSINRRQFLRRGAIALAGASLIRPNLIGAATTIITRGPAKKVVILGAGMAGLVAGYELTQLGHDVTILEARMRPGGRVHTLREPFSDGLYAEAGAARIPDSHDLTLKYVKLFDLPLEPMYPERLSALRFDRGRREVPISGFTEILGQTFGSDLGGTPSRWQKIKGGTDLLPKAFAQRLANKIQYGSPVVRIEQDAKAARAVFLHAGRPQTISADRILCTIPFSVLRSVELSGLSERKIEIIKRCQYDAVARVYLQTRNRFWEDKGLSGFAFTTSAVEIWHPTWSQPGPRGILMTYARPGEAERITNLKESDRISSTLAELDRIFPGLRGNFEGAATKCWLDDEWSRGAWAFVGVSNFIIAVAVEGGRIHFAGEHLSPWSSWIQGALSSGLRAVKEIDAAA